MSSHHHLKALLERHEKIDHAIAKEIAHRAYDEARIALLKKEKLNLKDEIERLKHEGHLH